MRTTITVRKNSNYVPSILINSGELGSFTWDFENVMDTGDSILSAVISPRSTEVAVEISNVTNQAKTVSATVVSVMPVGRSTLLRLQIYTVSGFEFDSSVWITTEFL